MTIPPFDTLPPSTQTTILNCIDHGLKSLIPRVVLQTRNLRPNADLAPTPEELSTTYLALNSSEIFNPNKQPKKPLPPLRSNYPAPELANANTPELANANTPELANAPASPQASTKKSPKPPKLPPGTYSLSLDKWLVYINHTPTTLSLALSAYYETLNLPNEMPKLRPCSFTKSRNTPIDSDNIHM